MKITVNTLFMAYVYYYIRGQIEKNETESKSRIIIVHRVDMHDPECFFPMKSVTPDFFPFTCPSRFGKMQPQLKSHGYSTGWG